MTEQEFIKKLNNEIKCVAFDLDGTVYLSEFVLDGARETLNKLRKKGIDVLFLTNNSSRTEEYYVRKLKNMELFMDGDKIVTSGDATIRYIEKNEKNATVHLLGTSLLKRDFESKGINLVSRGEICVLSYDTDLTYEKLAEFCINVRDCRLYIATHPDDVCPSALGALPDVGSLIELIKKTSNRTPDIIIGKPNIYLGDYVLGKYGYDKNQVLMVGDRLYTDIRFANNCGFCSLLVLSGETNAAMAKDSDDKASFILPSVKELAELINLESV